MKRLFHPIVLAVALVGVAGFLLGLIIAVERQVPGVVAPQADPEAENRIARLETELAQARSEVATLQGELTARQTASPSPAADADAENRIETLEAALADSSVEREALVAEVAELSDRLAETIKLSEELLEQSERARSDSENELAGLQQQLEQAIQTRDESRAQNEQVLRDGAAERSRLEQQVADLQTQLDAAQEQIQTAGSAAAPPQANRTPEPVREGQQSAQDTAPRAEQAAVPADAATEPTPSEPDSAKPDEPADEPVVSVSSVNAIAQGISAYRTENYRGAYEIWLPEALNGSPRAQFFVGALYFEGRGVSVDRVASYLWLREATRNNAPGASRLLERLREVMSGPELAEAETRIASGETIPAR